MRPIVIWLLAGTITLGASVVPRADMQQPKRSFESVLSEEEQRLEWQKVEEILQALGLHEGARVADVGAGHGFFTARLARAVGSSGRVFAVEIDREALDFLRARVSREQLTNVEVIVGDTDDPRLPSGSLDAALIANAYHEMQRAAAILKGIRRALKPGGRLVLVEPMDPERWADGRERQTKHHSIASGFAVQEVRVAGFEILALQDPFLKRTARHEEWLLVAQPPAGQVPAATPTATRSRDIKSDQLRISLEDFKPLQENSKVLVIDVRDEESYRTAHIPGAVNIPLARVESKIPELQVEKRPIVTYCS